MEALLAIDMGGSKYMAGLVTRAGEILDCERREWLSMEGAEVLPLVIQTAKQVMDRNPGVHAGGIGATIPGLADGKNGVWLEASFSGIRNLPVAQAFQEAFQLPAYADNDGQACALAEKLYGGGQGLNDFLYVTVSNGIGGAAFSGGRLLRGSRGCAFELGHCPVKPQGRACKCGAEGCLEAYAAGPGLSATYRELSGEKASGREIAALARSGDPAAVKAFSLEGEYLGLGLSWTVNLFNPEKIILGGGLSLAYDLYEKPLKEALRRHTYHTANPCVAVERTRLGYEGALLGAAAVCVCRMENKFHYFENGKG